MKIIPINDLWQLYSEAKSKGVYESSKSLPLSVYDVLMENSVIEDPYVGENEKAVQWVGERAWTFEREFELDIDFSKIEERIFLQIERVDTLANIYINNDWVSKHSSFFLPHSVDITDYVHKGKNSVKISIASALSVVKNPKHNKLNNHHQHADIRKPPYLFGWDWAPRLIAPSLFGVSVVISKNIRFVSEDVYTTISNDYEKGTIYSSLNFSAIKDEECVLEECLSYKDQTIDGGSKTIRIKKGKNELELEYILIKPKLWQPNTCGESETYTYTLSLRRGEETIWYKDYVLGFKSVRLIEDMYHNYQLFLFEINGRKTYLRGFNWIPLDSIPARITKERYREAIEALAEANVNFVRVWGGGYYETEEFYELCSEYGILVYQDFIFANSRYDDKNEEFMKAVEEEAIYNILRIKKHPSLLAFNGCNEIDWQLPKEDGKDIWQRLLPSLVEKYDGKHPYTITSPSGGAHPNSENAGTQHLWHTWHGFQPISSWNKPFTFVDEFGIQGFCDEKTISEVISKNERYLHSKAVINHQKDDGWEGMSKLMRYTLSMFSFPKNFSELIYKSQAAQAEAVSYGIDIFRRNKPIQWGINIWQFNDSWHSISWSAVDYRMRRKALYYFVKRAYAPIRLIFVKNDENTNAVDLHIVNDTDKVCKGYAKVSLYNSKDKLIGSKIYYGECRENERLKIATVELDNDNKLPEEEKYYYAEFVSESGEKYLNHFMFMPLVLMKTMSAKFKFSIESAGENCFKITLKVNHASYYTRLRITNEEWEYCFSDNYFHLFPHEEKEILCKVSVSCSLKEIEDSLEIKSLRN